MIHVEMEHVGGERHLLHRLTQRYWVIHAGRLVKKVVRNCVRCRLRTEQPVAQKMSPLPDERVVAKDAAPFRHTIIDVAGPFKINQGRASVKRYILVFACMIVRCVHLEVLFQLDAASFLAAFARFSSRRGVPTHVRSDCGTNFVRGAKELENIWDFSKEALHKYPRISWDFSTPRAPHTNGAVERLIGVVKRALEAVLQGELRLDEELFQTAVIKAEGLVNSRPLTYVSSDEADATAITPGDFLLPGTLREASPLPVSEDGPFTKRLGRLNNLLDQLWCRFVSEYVPTQRLEHKWHHQESVRENDVVALLEKNHKGTWTLGRIKEVLPDEKDNVVRRVIIEISENGVKKNVPRHVSKVMKILPDKDGEIL